VGLGHSPSIVLNGLVLALDAGNTKSYIGSGTTWTDLIGRGNTGTLTNGPTYNNTSGGSIVFDGTNGNVSIGTNGFSFGSSAGTLSAWAKTRDHTSTGTIVSYGSSVSNQARFLGVGQSNFYFSGYGTSISASGLSYDTWFNLVGVYDGTNAASMYVNGALVSGPTARSWTTVPSNAGIGKNVNNSEYWKGDVAQVQIYNRALSAEEIKQNYNAFKGRYATYISEEEPTITVSVSPSSVQEDGTTNLVYTFTSDRIVTNNVTVNYTISGTATSGVDYTSISGSVIITTGTSTATVTVDPTLDSTIESDETVILTISSGAYTIGSPSSATGTILNDDFVPSQVQYTSTGTYSWTCPSGVYSVSAAVVGGGGGGSSSTYSGSSGTSSYFISQSVLCAGGGDTGGVLIYPFPGSGGAGGGVVAGDGGIGGGDGSSPSDPNAVAASRQGAGGGRAGALLSANLGTNGLTRSSGNGFEGSGAKIDENVTVPSGYPSGGLYYGFGGYANRGAGAGGGGAVAWKNNIPVVPGQSYTLVVGSQGGGGQIPPAPPISYEAAGSGGGGAVRIMWGTGRSYPSTNITNI
jgi:hypothetical protein